MMVVLIFLSKSSERRTIKPLLLNVLCGVGGFSHVLNCPQVDKLASHTKPKKTPTSATTAGKMTKKSKEKQISGSHSAKKKPSLVSTEPKPEGVITKKSKEISNRLAEAKQLK